MTLSPHLDLPGVGSNTVLCASSGDGNQAVAVFTPLPFLNAYHSLQGSKVLALSIHSVCRPTVQAYTRVHSAYTHIYSAKAPSGWVLSTDQDEQAAQQPFGNSERAWVSSTLDAISQHK